MDTAQRSTHDERVQRDPSRARSLGERAAEILQQRQRHVSDLAHELKKKEDEEFSQYKFKPKITKLAREKPRETDMNVYFDGILKIKEGSLRALAEQQRIDYEAAHPPLSLSGRTEELARKHKAHALREGQSLDAAERLQTVPAEREAHLRELEERILEEQTRPVPEISDYAKQVHRPGSVFERLYHEQFELAERQREREEAQHQLEEAHDGQYTFEPRVNTSSPYMSIRRDHPTKDLYERSMEAKDKREMLREEEERREKARRRPQILERSRELESQLPTTAIERLLSPLHRTIRGSLPRDHEDEDLTFEPHLVTSKSKTSRHITGAGFQRAEGPVEERLLKYAEEKEQRLEKLRSDVQSARDKEVSLRPKIHKHDSHRQQTGDVVSRLISAGKKREENLERAREDKRRKEEEEARQSFTPKLSSSGRIRRKRTGAAPGSDPRTPKHRVKVSEQVLSQKGVSEHFQRLERARRERAEKEALLEARAGDNWSPKLTKPEPFSFTHSRKVKSLQKPVSPTTLRSGRRTGTVQSQSDFDSLYERLDADASYPTQVVATSEWLRRQAEKRAAEEGNRQAETLYASAKPVALPETYAEAPQVTRSRKERSERDLDREEFQDLLIVPSHIPQKALSTYKQLSRQNQLSEKQQAELDNLRSEIKDYVVAGNVSQSQLAEYEELCELYEAGELSEAGLRRMKRLKSELMHYARLSLARARKIEKKKHVARVFHEDTSRWSPKRTKPMGPRLNKKSPDFKASNPALRRPVEHGEVASQLSFMPELDWED